MKYTALYIMISGTDNITCEIIYDNFHVKIIAFQTITNHSFWTFYIGGKPVVYIINRKIHAHGCLEIPDLFLVLNMIFLTRSLHTLKMNLVFPRIHVLFSI